MKLHIDWTLCDGRGLCVELLPEVLHADEWGFPVGSNPEGKDPESKDPDGNDIPVSRDLTPHVRRAIAQCPRSALHLIP